VAEVVDATAVGGTLGTGSTRMFTEAEPVTPRLSVTVSVTGWVPTVVKVKLGCIAVDVLPPPKSHR
jgi:hypothetical protein